MMWFVYDNGVFYGTVIASDTQGALTAARLKFGNHLDSHYEVFLQPSK